MGEYGLIMVLLVLLGIVGGFNLFCPDLVWQLEHLLDVRGGEPTDFYLKLHRIVGSVCLAAAAVGLVVCAVRLAAGA